MQNRKRQERFQDDNRPKSPQKDPRDNRFNLWFVLIADNQQHLQTVVKGIESSTGYQAMVLPMLADYYINLGFDLNLYD